MRRMASCVFVLEFSTEGSDTHAARSDPMKLERARQRARQRVENASDALAVHVVLCGGCVNEHHRCAERERERGCVR
eukprot:998072-Rhodomonas_salina.1